MDEKQFDQFDAESLKNWFLGEKRELPWRDNPTPYQVWVSEVMLQQTQVSVVIPYFLRWIERFPSLKDLAEASIDEVIKMWEGLGYYSRARHLHAAARKVIEMYDGIIPSTEAELTKIKGIGPYTMGAIMSFAFKKKKAAVDGNVVRVLTRYFAISEDISKPKTITRIRKIADCILPDHEPWLVSEGLIELGAKICVRRPNCSACPLRSSCRGYKLSLQHTLPHKSAMIKITSLHRGVALIFHRDLLLVKRGEKGKIMSDLYEFPYINVDHKDDVLGLLKEWIQDKLCLSILWEQDLGVVKQTFTRYKATLFPSVFRCEFPNPVEGYEWKSTSDLENLAFSSGHRRIFRDFFL